MVQFYKPTPKNKGTACSFSLAQDNQGVMLSMVKQKSWDTGTSRGKFHTSKKIDGAMADGEGNAVTLKLGRAEVAGIIDSLETNRKWDAYHKFKGKESSIHFGPYRKSQKNQETGKWEEVGDQAGYSLSVVKSKPEKHFFRIGFDFAEGRLLRFEMENFLLQTVKEYTKPKGYKMPDGYSVDQGGVV